MKFDFDIVRPYVRLLIAQEPFPPNYDIHKSLYDLNREYGPQTINNTLKEYWERFGSNGEQDSKLWI